MNLYFWCFVSVCSQGLGGVCTKINVHQMSQANGWHSFVFRSFQFQSWYLRPVILTEVFCGLPQAIQANARLLSQIMW